MEITQQQFETNFETLQDEEKAMVAGLIENNEPTTLQAFAKVLGITFDLPEPEPMPEPSEEISEPEKEIPQTDEMSPITRELMALGDQPTEPVGITGPIQKEGADNSGVADDVLMDAEQKSFIVNAAALKLFGYGDFVNRILKPNIKSLKERTGQVIELATITQPQQQVQGDTPIAASNRELYIPPLLAEEIGYELLEKINNRGKPETEKKLEEQKQKEQPQEPQAAMQAALGKRVGMRNGGEVEMLARLLIAEAISGEDEKETYRNMQSVANVVSNRLKDKTTDFKKYESFKDVISDKTKGGRKQFSGYQDENYKGANTDRRYSTALDIASKAIAGTLEDITEGATFFYNPNETEPKDAKFFEDRLKSGRFQLVGRIGLHDILFDTHSSLPKRPIPIPKEKPKPINSPPEGRELLKEPPRGMRSGLDKVQPVMDKREITQFPERVLQ
tara:strand:- start:1076 stop:2419 length:1344 start_codon:yes stop_codon:yes gene_type:complete